jgi:hypothetical protein
MIKDDTTQHTTLADPFSVCWLKTKGQNFKEFILNLKDGALHFFRPKSTQ